MILGTICARAGSKGVAHKNTRILNGFPLVEYTLWHALQCDRFDRILVSTDDPEVWGYAKKYNLEVQDRPAELATDTASKWDVFRHITKTTNLQPDDILVDLDIGCPLRAVGDIDDCIEKLERGKFDVICTAYNAERNPYFNMVEIDQCEKAVISSIFNGWQIDPQGWQIHDYPFTRRQDAPPVWGLSPAVFAIRVSSLEKYKHWALVDGWSVVIIPRERAWDIDSELDFEIVEYLKKKGM